MKWLSEFRVGFADEYPDFETPKLNLPDNDGFVDWTKPVLWQVGDLKERYTVSQHSNFDFFFDCTLVLCTKTVAIYPRFSTLFLGMDNDADRPSTQTVP